MSDVTVGKWIKKICEVGVEVLEGDRISAEGFTILNDYQQAKNKAAFLENLELVPVEVLPPDEPSSTLAIRKESTIVLPDRSSEIYKATAADYSALDDIEMQMVQEFEELYAEFNQLDLELETSREQEEAIYNRRAAMRGMRRAMGEANTEKKHYVSVTNQLRSFQGGKGEAFR
ncbi:MAG: hypothetical protein SVX43_10955 [Cyanobacteriota bacterium]|nr:hypothetical protein [Cyanobacteriota bacterium]